jgi:parallel beta-helix repeat protein
VCYAPALIVRGFFPMRSSRAINLVLAIAILLCVCRCSARTISVDDDGTADFDNIQAAIDDANHFDAIVVADGTYRGPGNCNIEFGGKAITVRSANGPGFAIIDCETEGHGVYIVDNNTAEARLEGFTITNTYHGAIKIYSSSPPRLASGEVATDADGPYRPGYKDVVISNCTIIDNRDAGILLDGHDNATIEGCHIAGNGGGGVWSYMSWPAFRNCAIVGNEQTGIRATGATVANCTVADNAHYGIWMYEPTVGNSIIRGNGLGGIYDPGGDAADVTYCCIEGGFKGRGNIDADPCFADANGGDYHLKSQAGRWDPESGSWIKDDVTSPCIDAGDPMSPIAHEPFANGGLINMGAYGGTAKASKSFFGGVVCETIVAGDINGDCRVDFRDFTLMALHWLEDNGP